MSSTILYDGIYSKNKELIRSGKVQFDEVLSFNKKDTRLGISLIIPVISNEDKYDKLLDLLKKNEPDQYYYPFEDLHITIFDYIQAVEKYKKNPEKKSILIEITEKALKEISGFEIELKGIAFSNEAGIIQGYDRNILIQIRKRIRELMKKFGLKNNERYESESAHITFCRFMNKLKNPEKLIEIIDRNRDYEIGKEKVEQIELVEHDWYNKKLKKRIIKIFYLINSLP